ncbi:response regulator [Parerythrobacter aestuarii]|uniref:response regulator n=1 Tax=Parerythrobacter aestuarii TaxID=3020909 RepID=UPI0024DE20B8|nr:response regulator [Parerythrobacter aestuarii]
MAHILIVDDDELIAELAAEILISGGHACGWVTDGKKALELLNWKRPDLVLLDQDMPGMSGAQVLRQIRASPSLYDLPVIMFTAMSGASDEEQARYNGAQDYIRKPFDQKFMLLKIRQVLAARAEGPKHRDLREFLAQSNGIRAENQPHIPTRRFV